MPLVTFDRVDRAMKWIATMVGVMAGLLSAGSSAFAEAPGEAVIEAQPASANPTATDPNGDRTWFGSTAFLQPQGAVTVSNHMGLLWGVTLGVTDRFALDAHAASAYPLGDSDEFAVSVGAKLGIGSLGRFHFAATANYARLEDGYKFDDEGHVSVVSSACLSESCAAVVSASLGVGRIRDVIPNYKEIGGYYSVANVGVYAPINDWLKGVAEISIVPFVDEETFMAAPAAGLRVHSERWALEAVAVAVVGSNDRDRFYGEMIPIPWLSAAYRFQL